MAAVKKTLIVIMVLFFSILLVAPIAALYFISRNEIASLVKQEKIVIQEVSYGEPKSIFFGSIKNSIVVSGTVIGCEIDFIELREIPDSDRIRFIVRIGDYIENNTVIGFLNGNYVYSGKKGVIREINCGSDGYILLDLVEPVALECFIDTETAYGLFVGAVFTDDDGNHYRITAKDEVAIEGNVRVIMALENSTLVYGTRIESLKLYTGAGIDNVLMVSRDCVYSYPDSDKQYVRVVDSNLFFIKELEVKTWISDESFITVSGDGVEEGLLCDSGYKLIAEGGRRYE